MLCNSLNVMSLKSIVNLSLYISGYVFSVLCVYTNVEFNANVYVKSHAKWVYYKLYY